MTLFQGLNDFQIGIPHPGCSYLFVNLLALEGITHQDALLKLQDMGYQLTLRYWDWNNGSPLSVCALLKVQQDWDGSYEKDALVEEFETLCEVFGTCPNAVRFLRKRPRTLQAA